MRDKKLQKILTLAQALSARQRKMLATHLAAMDKAPQGDRSDRAPPAG